MAASIEKSRDMQMRNRDVIVHVTALGQSEPSTQLNRSAPGDGFIKKGAIYANLRIFMQMSCDIIGHVTALDQSEPSTLDLQRPIATVSTQRSDMTALDISE